MPFCVNFNPYMFQLAITLWRKITDFDYVIILVVQSIPSSSSLFSPFSRLFIFQEGSRFLLSIFLISWYTHNISFVPCLHIIRFLCILLLTSQIKRAINTTCGLCMRQIDMSVVCMTLLEDLRSGKKRLVFFGGFQCGRFLCWYKWFVNLINILF